MDILSNKVRFIKYVVDDTLDIRKYTKAALHDWLLEKEFLMEENGTFGYLINMPMYQMTKDMVDNLNKSFEDKKAEHKTVIDTSIETMWETDLEDLDKSLDIHLLKSLSIDETSQKRKQTTTKKNTAKKTKK
jgi:hypothetical protein